MADATNQLQPMEPQSNEANHGAAGKRGWDYQVNVTLLCYLRGFHRGYTFELKIEKEGNGKFDDVEFRFQKNDKKGQVLIQTKYKEREAMLITYNKLVDNKTDKRFYLKTYFDSCKSMKDLSAGDTLCIYTNMGVEPKLFEEVSENDALVLKELLAVGALENGKCPKFYRLKYSDKFAEDLKLSSLEDKNLFKKFVEKLVFAVNQPNNEELSYIIGKEITGRYNLINSSDIFKKLSAEISDYVSNPSGKSLSDTTAKQYFESIQVQLISNHLLSLYFLGEERQKNSSFSIFGNSLSLSSILDTNETLIQLSSPSTSLSFMKVVQYFKTRMNEDSIFEFGFAAVDIKTLLKNVAKTKSSLKNLATFYLVVEVTPLEKSEHETALTQLKAIISDVYRSTLPRKLILVSSEEDKLCRLLLRGKSYEYLDDKCQFKDFSAQFREKIVEKLVAEKGQEFLLKNAEDQLKLWKFPNIKNKKK